MQRSQGEPPGSPVPSSPSCKPTVPGASERARSEPGAGGGAQGGPTAAAACACALGLFFTKLLLK